MQTFYSLLKALILATVMILPVHANTLPQTPVGYWKTLDEVTGQPKSIVQIWETDDHRYAGKVIKIFANGGANKTCDKCSGNKHNQPIVGMMILTGLKQDQMQWNNGEILDPENGKTYKCRMRLTKEGQLHVRGYIGLPLLGRSQVWQPVKV